MSSSVQGKPDTHLRLVSDEEPVVVPAGARPNDDSPTVISKSPPLIQPISSNKDKITELARRPVSAESIVEGLRGRKLAHFELIEPIGVGGMAAVIRARDTQLDRFVALKILPPDMAKHTDNVQRFHQEAKAAAKLDHENIARVFFCGADQDLHFIAFEFVEGINLRTMLERRGRIPVAEAVGYILQVATGLEHATTRGVVHRDVKPSNIIVTPDGRAKLVDMGLARNLERRGEADLTQSGMTLGTFDYISPEQALEPREADARSDIYSLGCTFYHMLTGQSPVPEGTPAKKLHHHQHEKPLDPRDIDPSIPTEVIMVLKKMMAKNPRDRFQRPIHLVHHLLPLAKKLGVADNVPEGVLFVDAPLPTQPQTKPLMVIGLALAALVAVTLILSLAPTPQTNTTKTIVPTKGNEAYAQPGPKPALTPAKSNGSTPSPRAPKEVTSIDDLRAVLNDPDASEAVVKLDAPITLEGERLKATAGRRLTLKSDDANSNVLRFVYENAKPPIGLLLEGADEVVFHKIKFQNDSSTAPNQSTAPIAVRGVKRVRFEYCIWSQPNAQKISQAAVKRVPFASLLIDASEDASGVRPEVIVENCFFEGSPSNGGQVAIAVNGLAALRLFNSAFRSHSAFISFRDKCTRELTSLSMERCTGLVHTGPVIRFSKDAAADVKLAGNAFGGPPSNSVPLNSGLPAAGLLHFAGDKPIRFDSRDNLYASLNVYIEKPGESDKGPIAKQEDYLKELGRMKGTDVGSLYLDGTAFQTPNAPVEAGPLAFQLKAEYADRYGIRTDWLEGKPLPTAAIVVAKAPLPNPREKIVDADKGGAEPNVYSTLEAAINDAKDGDTIRIRQKGAVVVKPCSLQPQKFGSVTVTLKPFDASYRPILVLDENRRDLDLAMFDVQAGTLILQDLELRLDPSKSGYEVQSLVQLGESAQCSFRNCVLTLKRMTKAQLNVVTFRALDSKMMMSSDVPSTGARAEFRDCFVRGMGDLVAIRGCRPLQVEIEDSLIALGGQLLDLDAVSRAKGSEKAMMSFKMTRSSVFTTESAFSLRAKSASNLAKTEFKLEGCLLAALSADEPIASLMLNDTLEDKVGEFVVWENNKQNFYANFDKMRMWEDEFHEMNSKYDKLTFPKLTDDVKQSLWDATPDLFRPMEPDQARLKNYGLQLTPEIEQRWLPAADEVP